MLFWFSVAFLINLWSGNSAKNAVSLLGLWVIFLLLVPAVVNQLGNTIYPMPSRTLLINKMRTLKADVTKKQDEILDNFLRDHPEYAINDTTQSRSFWHGYMASQKLIHDKLQPELTTYDDQLKKQQKWINNLKWVSPAILAQESLNKMAGTSTEDYEHYRKQVITFSGEWREHFVPFLYNNKDFTQADYANLPNFNYQSKPHDYLVSFLVIFLMAFILFGFGLLASKNWGRVRILKV